MVLSAALDKGFIFLSLVAIITSVIGAVYYLNIVKEIYFNSPIYVLNYAEKSPFSYNNLEKNPLLIINNKKIPKVIIKSNVITLIISIITLMILLFIFINKE
jgi:NADH-ubiquinone oxidoreductase chain 2